jgi:hypothetical protein
LVHGYLKSGRLPAQVVASALNALRGDANYLILPGLDQEIDLQPLRQAVEAAVANNPKLRLADALLRVGRDKEADRAYDAAEEIDPGGPQRAAHYAEGGDWVALQGIRQAITLQPENWRPHAVLGRLLASRVMGSNGWAATEAEGAEAIASFNRSFALAADTRRLRLMAAECQVGPYATNRHRFSSRVAGHHALWGETLQQHRLRAGETVLRRGVRYNSEAWMLHNNLRYTYCEWLTPPHD